MGEDGIVGWSIGLKVLTTSRQAVATMSASGFRRQKIVEFWRVLLIRNQLRI